MSGESAARAGWCQQLCYGREVTSCENEKNVWRGGALHTLQPERWTERGDGRMERQQRQQQRSAVCYVVVGQMSGGWDVVWCDSQSVTGAGMVSPADLSPPYPTLTAAAPLTHHTQSTLTTRLTRLLSIAVCFCVPSGHVVSGLLTDRVSALRCAYNRLD